MEAFEEVMDSPKDHTHIIKGKRTKRQRPQSPIPLSIAAHTSSGDGGGGYGSNGDNFNAPTATANNKTSSPATSVEFVESVTEEEEDMANCLILLAQGHSRHQSWKPNDHHEDLGLKFTSKRFLEAPATGNGKARKYFYQCKTCDRSFPSFQALGGHRASHKKAKPAVAEKKRPMMMLLSDDEEEQYKNRVSSSSYFSLQLSNNSKSSSKVHECSVCGAEFMSGQALGGHMRRHRAPILSLSPSSPSGFGSQYQEAKRPRKVLSLDLDLNLPAPEDDHHRESKFSFASKQQKQQSSLVLSTAPTLVDCHY